MDQGGPFDAGDNADSKEASMWTPMVPMMERQGIREHAESTHAQEVRDLVAGPCLGSFAPLGSTNAKLVAAINTLQGTVKTLAAMLPEKQSVTQYPTVAPSMLNA